MITLYGIRNCDTVKRARKWLESRGIEHRFHDFREDGLDRARVECWLRELGWEKLVNRRSTSWKQLDAATREGMDDEATLEAILAQPTLIKRPLLEIGDEYHSGFSPAHYAELFNKHTL